MRVSDIKERASKSWGQLTPEQKRWAARALFFMGCGILYRAASIKWPSPELTLLGLGIFVAAIAWTALYFKSISIQGLTKWLVLMAVGGVLNFIAILANRGFMPIVPQGAVFAIAHRGISRIYWWVYPGDWIGGVLSIGDVLIVAAFMVITITILRRQNETKGIYSH